MGQQQLLLLVLSTVIVGLATVAGIQAFSENQAQASQDALVQRGTAIASDIQGLAGRPEQMGGIDLSSGSVKGADVADALGYETTGNKSGKQVKADGAGSSGTCTIEDQSTADEMTVKCTSDDAPQDVSVTVNPSNANDGKSSTDAITTSFS